MHSNSAGFDRKVGSKIISCLRKFQQQQKMIFNSNTYVEESILSKTYKTKIQFYVFYSVLVLVKSVTH